MTHFTETEPEGTRYVDFPIDALPEPVESFVRDGSEAIGCAASYLALPLLTALASAIGGSRRLQLKRTWSAPAILWSAIVGESGSGKSPALRMVLQPFLDRQHNAYRIHAEEMRNYKTDLAVHEKEMASWNRNSSGGEPPAPPEEPSAERFIVNDITVEALAPILSANPRGLLLELDELSGWIGSFDKYSSGKSDESRWLSIFSAKSFSVDRKSSDPKTITVPNPSVSVTGGIQPAILREVLGSRHRESGLAGRLLMTYPPRSIKKWNEREIDPAIEDELLQVIDRLYGLDLDEDDAGRLQPTNATLTADAKAMWIEYYNEHNREQVELSGDLAAAWSKLEEYPARLALVIHYVRWAADATQVEVPDVVDEQSIAAGITLANWFKKEAQRVYRVLDETAQDNQQRKLVEWIERKGGQITARQLQQGHRWITNADQANRLMDELEIAGLGDWDDVPPGPNGGQPTRKFCLRDASTSTQPHKSRDLEGSVDVDSLVDSELVTQTVSDDWGEV